MKKNFLIISIISLFSWSGCISEYDPGIEGYSNILVVEGFVTDGTTVIKLKRSVSLSESLSDAPVVNNAEVYVETSDGETFLPSTISEGSYYIQVGDMDVNKSYRVKIAVDGHTYASEFLTPIETPPIDTLTFYQKSKGDLIETRINSTGTDETSRYYMWSFNEIWEIKSEVMALATQEEIGGPITMHYPYSPYHYCWKWGNSNSILIGSSYKLNENKINEVKIAENLPTSDRFSMIYFIEARQNALRKETYDYFNTLKMNAESTGSIFGPTPSEMKGNIECLTDNTVPVIGYVEVSFSQYKTQIHDASVFSEMYEKSRRDCPIFETVGQAEAAGISDVTVAFDAYSFIGRICVDCRMLGGTKRKPAFWPNDHI